MNDMFWRGFWLGFNLVLAFDAAALCVFLFLVSP